MLQIFHITVPEEMQLNLRPQKPIHTKNEKDLFSILVKRLLYNIIKQKYMKQSCDFKDLPEMPYILCLMPLMDKTAKARTLTETIRRMIS